VRNLRTTVDRCLIMVNSGGSSAPVCGFRGAFDFEAASVDRTDTEWCAFRKDRPACFINAQLFEPVRAEGLADRRSSVAKIKSLSSTERHFLRCWAMSPWVCAKLSMGVRRCPVPGD